MDKPITEIIAFLVGVASGAAGKYFADKYTDQRKEQEVAYKEKQRFLQLHKVMPELFLEIKADITGDASGLVREFFVISNELLTVTSSKPRFIYYEEQHQDLRNKLSLLLDGGFIIEVSAVDVPIFQMTDAFIKLVCSLK